MSGAESSILQGEPELKFFPERKRGKGTGIPWALAVG